MATATAQAVELPSEPRRLHALFRRYPAVIGAIATCMGALLVIGWAADIDAITHPSPGIPITVANSGVMAMLSGVSLWLLTGARRRRAARVASRIAAGAVALLAIATLVEYVADVDLGIDRLIAAAHHAPWPVGRPSPYTASVYTLLSAALLLIDRKTRRGHYVADYIALLAEAYAIAALLGYLFGASSLYASAAMPYIGMSPFTTLVVLSLSIGILALHVEHGVISVVLAPDAGGVVARQLLTGLAVFPPIAIVVILGARLGWYGISLAAALTLLLALAESSVFILNTARRLSRIDSVQRKLTTDLRESEARVRALVEEAKDGIFLADVDGRYTDVNRAGCEMLGYARDEVIGKTIADLIPPEELPRLAAERERVLAGGTARGEWHLRHRDGSYIEVEVVSSLLLDRRWQAIVRDISERKRTARVLAEAYAAEQQLRADLEAVDIARAAVSEAVAALRGAHIDPVLAQIAEQARALTDASYAAVGIGSDPSKHVERWVTAGMTPDVEQAFGRGFPSGHPMIHSTASAAIRRAGRVIGYIYLANKRDAAEFTARDVRLLGLLADGAGLALQTARTFARLQSILDQLPSGVLVIDENEQVQVINRVLRAWVFDPTQPDSAAFSNPGKYEIHAPDGTLVPLDQLPLARAVRYGEVTTDRELVLHLADGTMLPIDARGAPIRDEAGKPAGAVVVVRDASERREMERLREEWLAVVAHDLRQPVHAIVFAFDLLFEHASEQDREILLRLRAQAFHLNRMIDDLLDAARIAAGRLAVEPTYGDICRIVSDAVDRIRMTQPDANIELAHPLEQVAWVDPERIHQVMANLLSNAIKYRAPDTPVSVTIDRTDEGVQICVCNQGPTIGADELPTLFSRFARTRSAKGKRGVGLGLYICKALVEAHGGRIWVESAEGTTRFYFTLKVPELPPQARA